MSGGRLKSRVYSPGPEAGGAGETGCAMDGGAANTPVAPVSRGCIALEPACRLVGKPESDAAAGRPNWSVKSPGARAGSFGCSLDGLSRAEASGEEGSELLNNFVKSPGSFGAFIAEGVVGGCTGLADVAVKDRSTYCFAAVFGAGCQAAGPGAAVRTCFGKNDASTA